MVSRTTTCAGPAARPGAPQAGGEPGSLGDGDDLPRTLHVARGHHHLEPREVDEELPVHVDEQLLLPVVRGSGDEDRPGGVEPEGGAQRLVVAAGTVEHQRVELGVSGDPDAIGRGAQLEGALGLLVGAHEEERDGPQRLADRAEEGPVPGELLGGEPAVGERDAHPGLAGGADQVGPDLGVLEHEQVGAQRGQGPPGRPGEVVGRVHDHVGLADLGARHLQSAVGDGRDHQATARHALLQLPHHGLEREEVAGAGAVEPDPRRALARGFPGSVVAEPLLDPVAQLRVEEQHRQEHRDGEVAPDRVEEVHGAGS